MKMTYRIAHSAGMDAANRQMRAAGRTAWNQEDAALAAATLRKCFPLCAEHPGIGPERCGCEKCCLEDRTQLLLTFRPRIK